MELKDVVLNTNLYHLLPRRKSSRGRHGYNKFSLFLAYILWLRERMVYVTELARHLRDNQTYREFCGFTKGKTPSHDTLSRFFRQMTIVRQHRILEQLDRLLDEMRIFDQDDLAIDATDVLSNGRNRHNPDPEAGWGYKTDKERYLSRIPFFLSIYSYYNFMIEKRT